MKHKRLLSLMRKAIDDYGMIKNGDKIAIGISGGKDSLALLLGLKGLQRFYTNSFEIEAISVSLGFDDMDFSGVSSLCKELDINYTVEKTDISEIIFNQRNEKNPCSLCAKMRKGALNDAAERLGCNVVALGHNKDDVVETLLMSLFYEGRIHSFAPVTYLDRKKLYSIRPLIYVDEKDIIGYARRYELPIVKNVCPVDGKTKRERIKNLISELDLEYSGINERLFGAIKRSSIKGWDNIEREY